MNSNESDVLDVDFDPDLLIHLLGKLKLDSIPEDISDTLSSIENRAEENICDRGFEAQNLAIDPIIENLQNNAIAREQNNYTSIQDVSTSSQSERKEVKIQKESSSLQAKYSTATQHGPSKEDIYPACDSLDFHWQRFPFSNTSSSRSFGCFPSLKKQGFSKQSCNSLTKSISSQDSGYDTSSTISPSPPFLSTETFNSDDFCHDEVDEQLESLLAGLVEVENTLLLPASPTNNSKVPVLTNAINPEEHKEKIVNFLKESPSIDSVQVSVILSNENSYTSETVENISEKDDENSAMSLNMLQKDDDGQIFIYKKGSINEKNKILKQIQDNERVHKIKLIRLLGRSLKRANDDDRENVKRRRLLSSKTSNKGTQLKDSCL
ncbi:uncharacterized protein CEXT_155281 [Caerostris extrusa]|uniref:Uncharacterized protein n=1 Tax=Caerostris extrusa TaxID=172846 RepID=A0AAV4Y6E8_CAEEX|nr:uncharacterized protein CEXT_155281 [Caerostris extrusa]